LKIFLAFDIELPFQEMGYALRNLMVEGRIPVMPVPAAVLTEPVFLSKTSVEPSTPSSRPLQWNAPFRSERLQSKQHFNIDRTFIRTSATLDRMYEVIPSGYHSRLIGASDRKRNSMVLTISADP
jgi:hypothetical protein